MYEGNSYSTLIHAVVLCESAQRYRALMVILHSHRTKNVILRCYTSETYQILSPVLFQQSLYFLLLKFTEFFYLSLLFFYMLCSIRREHSSQSFAPPQKWLFSMVTWGINCARTQGTGTEYSSCIIFVVYSTVGRTCSKRTQLPVPSSHGSKDYRSRYWRYIYPWQLRRGATPSCVAS